MRKIFLILIVSLISTLNLNAQVDFKLIPITDAIAQANESGKLVFVEFTAEGCPPCVVMEKNVFANPDFGNLVNKGFVAVKSNGLSVNSKFEKMRHKIVAFPTVVYFNAEGKELFRIQGKKSLEEMIQVTQFILNGEIEKAIEMFPLPVPQEENTPTDTIPHHGPIKRPE